MIHQRRRNLDFGTVRPGARTSGGRPTLPALFIAGALFVNLVLFIDWVESSTGFDSRVYLQVSTLPASFVAAAPAASEADAGEPEAATEQPASSDIATTALVQAASDDSQVAAADAAEPEASPIVAVQESAAEAGVSGKTIWVGGDSMVTYVARALISLATAEGAIAVNGGDAVSSSGVNSPGFFDWHAYIEAEIAEHDPAIMVFMIGANDAKPGMDLDAYHQRVGALMDAMEGRQVIWVGQPSFDPAIRPDLATSVPSVNEVFFLEAIERPWVTYVDTWTASTDSARAYARYLPDETGSLVEVRAGDGVHLTSAGGRLLAMLALDHIR